MRIDGVEHEDLQFFTKILKGKQVVAGQEPATLPGTQTMLVPSIFTVLEPGDYTLKIEFIAHQS